MPFQSEKQRRYMHANLPDIANRWEAKYGLGGIAELNQELNSLPAYYLPKNQGGRIGFAEGPKIPEKFLDDLKRKNYYKLLEEYRRWKEDYERRKDLAPTQEAAQGGLIPAHEAGIYGLAEGGQLVKPGPGRPGYGGPHETYGGGAEAGRGSGPSDRGPRDAPDRFGPTTTPTVTKTTTDEGPKDGPDPHGGDWEEGWLNKDLRVVNEIINDPNANRRDKEQALVWKDQFQKEIAASEKQRQRAGRNIFQKGLDYVTEHPWESALNVLSFGGVQGAKTALRINNAINWGDKILDTDIKTALKNGFTDAANKMKTHNAQLDVYESLPDGHPEKIALQAELEIGKKPPTDVHERDNGQIQETSIKIEDIEEVNDAKTQLNQKYLEMEEASRLARLRQQEMQEAKRQAYLRNFRRMYMSAQGGRVPQGYNTGGLSNLFKLKNV